ncbi:mucin-2-like [Eucyclogobius newberryi]|uniref:mucin-2-like n=1 Tax=Eucyclogobius newberryi TaxID=166745 RepID=UPI003B58CE88
MKEVKEVKKVKEVKGVKEVKEVKKVVTDKASEYERAPLPWSQGGVHVERSHNYIKVKASLGLLALWCPDSFLLELDNKFQNQTCGLCGDFNGVPLNEFYSHGVKQSLEDWASHWRKDGLTEKCPGSDPDPSPASCEHMEIT